VEERTFLWPALRVMNSAVEAPQRFAPIGGGDGASGDYSGPEVRFEEARVRGRSLASNLLEPHFWTTRLEPEGAQIEFRTADNQHDTVPPPKGRFASAIWQIGSRWKENLCWERRNTYKRLTQQ
jgi:hypothetical protein